MKDKIKECEFYRAGVVDCCDLSFSEDIGYKHYNANCSKNDNCLFKQLIKAEERIKKLEEQVKKPLGYGNEASFLIGMLKNDISDYKQQIYQLQERNQQLETFQNETWGFLESIGIHAGGELKKVKHYIGKLQTKLKIAVEGLQLSERITKRNLLYLSSNIMLCEDTIKVNSRHIILSEAEALRTIKQALKQIEGEV